jgi:hypothetical protein
VHPVQTKGRYEQTTWEQTSLVAPFSSAPSPRDGTSKRGGQQREGESRSGVRCPREEEEGNTESPRQHRVDRTERPNRTKFTSSRLQIITEANTERQRTPRLSLIISIATFCPPQARRSGLHGSLQGILAVWHIAALCPSTTSSTSSSSIIAEADERYLFFEDERSTVETPPPLAPERQFRSSNFLWSFGTTPSPKIDAQGLEAVSLLGWPPLERTRPNWNGLRCWL